MRAEILLIDPEVLKGTAPAGNGHWLARRVNWLGAEVARIAVIDRVAAAVSAELRRGLMAGAELIVLAGGRGPGDEVALTGIARALGLELAATGPRQGWPERAVALGGAAGPEAGAWVESEGGQTVLLSLPGSDRSTRAAVFDGAAMERIRARFGGGPLFEVSVSAEGRSESELYALADEVMAEVPGTYVRPVRIPMGQTSRSTLQVAAADADAEASRRMAEDAVRAVKFRLSLEI